MAHKREHLGHGDHALEDSALVDQVGEPEAAGLLPEFTPSGLAFDGVELCDGGAEFSEQVRGGKRPDEGVAELVELSGVAGRDHAKMFWGKATDLAQGGDEGRIARGDADEARRRWGEGDRGRL